MYLVTYESLDKTYLYREIFEDEKSAIQNYRAYEDYNSKLYILKEATIGIQEIV
jgi:hypothetical protein